MATSAAFTNSMENQILDVFFRNAGRTHGDSGSGLWIALSTQTTTASSEAWTGASMSEVTGTGYARPAVSFNTASGGICTSAVASVFTASGSDWGQAGSMALVDSVTVGQGNVLMFDTITTVTLNSGDTLTFAAGQITLTVT